MSMEMERLSLIVIHPIVGSTASLEGLVNIEPAYLEDKETWSGKSVEGKRILKKYKDPNINITVTVLRGSDMEVALSRALLYPKAKGSASWLDERIDGVIKGGTGVLEAISQTTDNLTDENAQFILRMSKYVSR